MKIEHGKADFDGSTGQQHAAQPSVCRVYDDPLPLALEYRPAASLIPYARNARTHSDAQVAEIAASIREFGWTNPILIDGNNGIIAGHGRLLAARKLGLSEVPVCSASLRRRSGPMSSPTTSWP